MLPVVVIGGGMAGLAAASRLARRGLRTVLIEALPEVGGVARSFEIEGRRHPLAYHHILPGDADLRAMLVDLDLWPRVRWRPQRMEFLVGERAHALGSPRGLATFPMGVADKAGLARVLLSALVRRAPQPDIDAARWLEQSLPRRESLAFFRDLCELRYGRDLSELSASWLHARIRAMEAVGPLGCMPGTEWTYELVEGLKRSCTDAGVEVITGVRVSDLLRGPGEHVLAVGLADGRRIPASAVLSTLPPPVLLGIAPELPVPELHRIEYSAVISWVVCARRPRRAPRAYWTNALRPRRSFHGLFRLDRLDPGCAPPGHVVLDFAAHVMPRRREALWAGSDDDVRQAFRDDYRDIYGAELDLRWERLIRIPTYAPVAAVGYRNPPARVVAWPGLYLAGNFRTWPVVPTTGSAMGSGMHAADLLFDDLAEGRLARRAHGVA